MGSSFPIPMRGNETPILIDTEDDYGKFPIPMRGNESRWFVPDDADRESRFRSP